MEFLSSENFIFDIDFQMTKGRILSNMGIVSNRYRFQAEAVFWLKCRLIKTTECLYYFVTED